LTTLCKRDQQLVQPCKASKPAQVRTCDTREWVWIECCEPALWRKKAGAAIATEWRAVKWLCAGSVGGVRVAWAAHTACLAAVLGHWLALCLAGLLRAAEVPCLTPALAFLAFDPCWDSLAARGGGCTAFECQTL
jgi:hypothetical protein